MKDRFLLFCFALLLAPCSLFSQQTIFNRVVSPVGTFNGFVGGIAQDKNGYMWFATQGGLYKYDGYRFTLYSNDPSDSNSIGASHLETVYADREGIIWIALWVGGLDRLDPATGKVTHFRYDPRNTDGISDTKVRAILEDHEGTLWVGTHNGLDMFDRKTGKFKHFRHDKNDPHSLSSDIVRELYEDREGVLWVGTGSVFPDEGAADDGGLNRFDRQTGKFTRYVHDPNDPHSLINNKVQSLLEDSRGNFWVGTAGDGLHIMDRKTGKFERYRYDPAHPERLSRPALNTTGVDQIHFITEDAAHNIWIATLGNGINKYDPKTKRITHFGYKDSASGFRHNSGWSFCNSRDGVLWIGTYEGGLYRLDPYQKDIPHVTTTGAVFGFCTDSLNNFWIATTQGLIVQNRKTGISRIFVGTPRDPQSLIDNWILSIYSANDGSLWIGNNGGLNRYNPASGRFTAYSNLPRNTLDGNVASVYAIKAAGGDTLCLGTSAGIVLMDERTGGFISFANKPKDSTSISPYDVVCLLPEKSGNIWAGDLTAGGLNYFDRKTRSFTHFLKGLSVSSVIKDHEGTIWVGTDVGVYYRKDPQSGFQKFKFFGSAVDVTNVLSIVEDDNKNIWVSTSLGIFRINGVTQEVMLYGANRNISADDLTPISGYKGPDGSIYFGASNGYYTFSPSELGGNPTAPQVVFTSFIVQGKPIIAGKDNILPFPLQATKKISLAYDQNVFSFDFAGIHYASPENNRHLYMLENYDQTWRGAGAEKSASYFNVPPGHYIFHVKAASSDGVWAEKSIAIVISPPWWRTWWAYCMYALLLLGVIVTVDRFQKARVIRAERERTRERELAQAKEIEKAYHKLTTTQAQLIQSEKMASLGELTAGIAHEIQNPLNFVNNFSEVNRELLNEMLDEVDKGNTQEASSLAKNIIDNEEKIIYHGKRADAIVKSMLQHSRISTGQKEPTDINALTDEYLRLSYHGMRAKDKSFNVELRTDFDDRVGKVSVVAQDIGRVLINLFNNAFYAVMEKQKSLSASASYAPLVEVVTKKLNAAVEIRIKDNGPGISQKVIDKIYQPFFTTKPAGQGTGLGLSLSYDVISKEHGGQIKVNTKEGEFTEFIIELPA
ncbi:MAG TPA: two-component regulator propeller domain-containing protein [Parafilimonas sp.]|nr:two-component regulator propeller domain-containing protein [Parafilimonas sp.]